jgi:hypothetical protein
MPDGCYLNVDTACIITYWYFCNIVTEVSNGRTGYCSASFKIMASVCLVRNRAHSLMSQATQFKIFAPVKTLEFNSV